jgi:hypothetical protein
MGLGLLDRYNQKPGEGLAEEIARRMVWVDVAEQLRRWMKTDDAPAVGGAS